MEINYLIQPQLFGERLPDKDKQLSIVNEWTQYPGFLGLANNLNYFLSYSLGEKCFFFIEEDQFKESGMYSMEETISSPLALYRLLAMGFNLTPMEETPYKILWSVTLTHKETRELFQIRDYKGGVEIASTATSPDRLSPQVKQSILNFLNFLISDQVAHPYDLTKAGSVA
jgi:hypothetical protein